MWLLTVLIRRTKISPLIELERRTHGVVVEPHNEGEDLIDGGDVDVFKVNIKETSWGPGL